MEELVPQKQVQQLQAQGAQFSKALEEYKQFQITNQQTYDFACEQLREVSTKRKDFAAQEKTATQPINSALSVIRGWFKTVDEPLKSIEQLLKQKIAAYTAAEQDKNQAKLNEAAALFQQGQGTEGLKLMTQVQAAPVAKAAGVSTVKRITFRYTDEKLVPREYCAPVDALIRAQVKLSGLQTKIPGVEVYEELGVSAKRI